MKFLTTTLVIIMLLIGAGNTFAEGTWTTFPEKLGVNSITFVSDVEILFAGPSCGVWRYDGETWISFTDEGGFSTTSYSNNVFSIASSSEGDLWFGTRYGVTRYNGETWTSFDEDDGLPVTDFTYSPIAITPGGMVWVASLGVGVSRYDGETWTTYTIADGLGSDYITSIAALSDDIVLFGTYANGISLYYGESWTYITAHDGLISDMITSIAIAQDGVIWVGASGGVSKYDGETWISYTVDDGLANNHVTSLATGSEGEVWVGSALGGGVSHYNGETWTTFTTDDGLANNRIYLIAVSPDNTVWVGTGEGLCRYIPETGTFVEETDVLPEEIEIITNYPNPFNPETTIEFSLPSESTVNLSIFNITGQKIRTLVSRPMTAGTHSIRWDGASDSGNAVSSGVYIARISMGNKVAARSMMLMK